MKILHISFSDKKGGAAIAAFRLNRAMQMSGMNSRMLVLFKKGIDENVIGLSGIKFKFHYYLARLLDVLICKFILHPKYAFSLGMWGVRISNLKEVREADVIYIHWVNNDFLSIKELGRISKKKKVIIFMHDMWAITGGCHYSFECDKYMNKCRDCKIIQNTFWDWAAFVFRKKACLLAFKPDLFFITPSNWLGKCVAQSSLFDRNHLSVIPNLLNGKIFKSIDKNVARSLLNLPLDKQLILFGADAGTSNPFKGWKYLKESLSELEITDAELVVFGTHLSAQEKYEMHYNVHSMGKLHDEYSLSLLYNAVDVFVTPSLADNFPNTILEALACGIPVVGFNVGGIPDLVVHQVTGYLAEYKNSVDLAKGIEWVLEQSNVVDFKLKLKQYSADHFSENMILSMHADLLKSIYVS